MAVADPGSRGPLLLLVVVLVFTGYVAWQVGPLSRRMDALDRDRLETNDRLQREIEKLRDQLERAQLVAAASRAPAPARQPAGEPVAQRADALPATAATAPAATPPRVSMVNAETFFNRRLVGEDAAIATLLIELPLLEVARRLKHSPAYIVAKGIQIEKRLAAVPDTPPDVLAALRTAVERAKAQR